MEDEGEEIFNVLPARGERIINRLKVFSYIKKI
jgi:hypothetical protein